MNKARRRSRKLRKESRTIPLSGNKDRGNGEDFRKYYRCWHCGFTCDVTRDDLGDSQSRAGDNHSDYHTPSYGSKDATDRVNSLAVLGGSVRCLANGSDGNPKGIRHDFESVITGGCPLCGSKNYRGDYP